ncbi:MAG: NADP-dependent malic enzyme, partial [Gammaproteobacteria bacterium]|nr:NADP-dependent malic enzyme [Gammaproteobacteria bacterium]
EINEAMKIACVHALSEVAQQEPSDIVKQAYAAEPLTFGPQYLLPKPFDPRLVTDVAPAVARAAMESGVATRPIEDFEAYRRKLSRLVYQSSGVMEPVFLRAQAEPMRLVYVDGEDERVLQATQQVIMRGMARPILLGREEYIIGRMTAMGLRVEPGRDFDIINPQDSSRHLDFAEMYLELMGRKGVSMARADRVLRNRRTAFGALLVRNGEADAMICGTSTPFSRQLVHIRDVIGKAEGVHELSTMVALILDQGTFFICDTHVSVRPKARALVEMTLLAAREVRQFGIEPKIALLSHSNFGTYEDKYARRIRKAAEILRLEHPELEVDGEMHGEVALSEAMRKRVLPSSKLSGMANLLIMPNIDAAHIAYTMLKMLGQGVTVGPILLGAARPVHIATQTITVRGLVNLSAYAVVQAQTMRAGAARGDVPAGIGAVAS